jgi:hypothetical protein
MASAHLLQATSRQVGGEIAVLRNVAEEILHAGAG